MDEKSGCLPLTTQKSSLTMPTQANSRPKSSRAVAGDQRSSIAHSLPGARIRLIAASRDQGTIGRIIFYPRLEEAIQLQTLP
jgi:hypothetical protein